MPRKTKPIPPLTDDERRQQIQEINEVFQFDVHEIDTTGERVQETEENRHELQPHTP